MSTAVPSQRGVVDEFDTPPTRPASDNKPTGRYVEQMLEPGGWPEVDAATLVDRAERYTQALRQLTEALETCQQQQGEIFGRGVWSGDGAAAANAKLEEQIAELRALQADLATVIAWHTHVAGLIVEAKSNISSNVQAAQKHIEELENDPRLDADVRNTVIDTLVSATYKVDVLVVASTAEQILATPGQPVPDAPPPGDVPGSTPEDTIPEEWASPDEPSVPPTPRPDRPAPPAPSAPRVVVQPTGTTALPSRSSLSKSTPSHVVSAAIGAGSDAPGRRSAASSSPAEAAEQPSDHPLPEDASPPAGPDAEDDGSPMGMAPAAFGGGGGGPGTGSAAPVGPAQSGTPQGTPSEAMTPQATARSGPAGRRRSQSDDGAMAGIPVSPARAARDEIADAAGPQHWRNPLRLARRVGAALNAPGSGSEHDFGFFWVTAVTADGKIVLANSYGLAYIPDGVQLPDKVHLASAEQAIPAAERARWATHPVMALQGWAAHHNTTLRAVIATAEQLANSDPGVTKIVLQPDDIPDSGTMTGRSRLQVVNPEAAERLSTTPDAGLIGLLPPAPANVDAPEDHRPMLWLEVMEPMMSGDKGREATHLRAFHAFAAAAKEAAFAEAHAAVDPVARRAAVDDWFYWQHLTGLLDEALADAR